MVLRYNNFVMYVKKGSVASKPQSEELNREGGEEKVNNGSKEKTAKKERNGKQTAKNLTFVAVFVAFMAVCTLFISIPFYPVPLTFQTMVCVLCGLMLGAKYGFLSMCVYVFLGFVCYVPVFAGGTCGFYSALKPTFGYIIGFAVAALVAGLVRGNAKSSLKRYILAGVFAFLTNYAIGIPYFLLIWKFHMNQTGIWQAAVTYNLIYMPKDLVLCVLAGIIAYRLTPFMNGFKREKLKRPETKTEK